MTTVFPTVCFVERVFGLAGAIGVGIYAYKPWLTRWMDPSATGSRRQWESCLWRACPRSSVTYFDCPLKS